MPLSAGSRLGAYEIVGAIQRSQAAATGKTYTTPSGITLNATYISYLRRTFPARFVRFRMTAARQSVLIVESGKAVGVLTPVAHLDRYAATDVNFVRVMDPHNGLRRAERAKATTRTSQGPRS
jgi:hypothetical protein